MGSRVDFMKGLILMPHKNYASYFWNILVFILPMVKLSALAEPLAQMPTHVDSGLNFVNRGSNMAAIILSPLKNLKYFPIARN